MTYIQRMSSAHRRRTGVVVAAPGPELPDWLLPTGVTANDVEQYAENVTSDASYTGADRTGVTWSAVFSLVITEADGGLFFKSKFTVDNDQAKLQLRTNEKIRGTVNSVDYTSGALTPGSTATTFMVYDGSDVYFYVNNVLQTSWTNGSVALDSTGDFGASSLTAGLDKLAIYNVALTSGQRGELHTDMLA